MSDEDLRGLERRAREAPDDNPAWEAWRRGLTRAGHGVPARVLAARGVLHAAERLFTGLQRNGRLVRYQQRIGPRLARRETNLIATIREDVVGVIRTRQRRLRRALVLYRRHLVLDEGVDPKTVATEAGRVEATRLLLEVFQHAEYQRPRRTQAERGRHGRAQDPFTILSRATERGIVLDRGQGMWAGRRAAEAWRLTHGGRDPNRMPEETADGVFNVFCYPRTNDYLAVVDAAIDAERAGESRRGLGARRAGRR